MHRARSSPSSVWRMPGWLVIPSARVWSRVYAANWPCAGVVMVEGTFWRFRLDVRPPSDEQFAEMIAETGFGWKGDAEALAIEQERLLGQLPEGARRYVPVRKLRERSFVQVGDHFERRPTAELVRAQVHWVPGEHPSYANDPDQFARIRCPIRGVFGTTGPHTNERDEVEEPFRSNDNADVHWLKGGHSCLRGPHGCRGLDRKRYARMTPAPEQSPEHPLPRAPDPPLGAAARSVATNTLAARARTGQSGAMTARGARSDGGRR